MENLIEFNGIYFNSKTPKRVMEIISNNIGREKRFRIWYGDTETGISWNDEYDTIGYFGRSTGEQKIPLLIKKKNSYGGGAILTHCIIKIREIGSKYPCYEHENFNGNYFYSLFEGDKLNVYYSTKKGHSKEILDNSTLYASYPIDHKNTAKAMRLIGFMNGTRDSK